MYGVFVTNQRMTPGSQTSLREANRARIIDAVKIHGSITQVELAGATGLSPATVSNIVKELTAAGTFHARFGVRSGRRSVEVTLARKNGLVIGIHFAARQMRIALADLAQTIISEHRMPLAYQHQSDTGLSRAALMINDMLTAVGANYEEIRAIGITLPAPFNIVTGTTAVPGLMRGWDGIRVATVFEEYVHRPTFVDNDANVGAQAEARLGAARGKDNIAYLRLSHGISGGLILGGALYRGKDGQAGAIGHISIDDHGPICRCGNRGCLEAFVGAAALVEQLPPTHRDLNFMDIVHDANQGDPICVRIVADAGRNVGTALAKVYNLLNLDAIVIGGELAETKELLLSSVRHTFERSVLGTPASIPDIVASELGLRTELIGAISLALDNVSIAESTHTGALA